MKPAAQLSGVLLARKGFAKPSSHNAAYHEENHIPPETPASKSPKYSNTSKPASAVGKASMTPREMQQDIKRRVVHKSNCALANDCKNSGDKDIATAERVAMTLRLDPMRHKRLRLISVHSQRSARDLITSALDRYLDQLEDDLNMDLCECLRQTRQ